MIAAVEQHRREIDAICRRYRLKRLELFGSAASGEFNPNQSDIDFFYEFDPNDNQAIADRFFALQKDLRDLLGADVDLVSAADVSNPYFLEVANRHRITLYAA